MMEILKLIGSTSSFILGVFYPWCNNEGCTKEECKLETNYCAIYVSTMNCTIDECMYNGARWALRMEVMIVQPQGINMITMPPPRGYGRGGGRFTKGTCWYWRKPRHHKLDCPLWLWHKRELNETTPLEPLPLEANVNMVTIMHVKEELDVLSYVITWSQGRLDVQKPVEAKGQKLPSWEKQHEVWEEATRWVRDKQQEAMWNNNISYDTLGMSRTLLSKQDLREAMCSKALIKEGRKAQQLRTKRAKDRLDGGHVVKGPRMCEASTSVRKEQWEVGIKVKEDHQEAGKEKEDRRDNGKVKVDYREIGEARLQQHQCDVEVV